MNTIPADTTIEAARKQIEILRSMGPQARLKTAFELSDNLRSIVEESVRGRNPSYDEQQIKQEVLRLMVGDALYREAFGENTKIE
jgi:hypothetical protein